MGGLDVEAVILTAAAAAAAGLPLCVAPKTCLDRWGMGGGGAGGVHARGVGECVWQLEGRPSATAAAGDAAAAACVCVWGGGGSFQTSQPVLYLSDPFGPAGGSWADVPVVD